MSLVQRVTSIEGLDRIDADSPSGFLFDEHSRCSNGYGTLSLPQEHSTIRRVLSYDAFAQPELPSQATNPTGGLTAYKVSPARRFAQVCFTILSCWFASGIIFGFAALKPVLLDQGVYRDLCTPDEIEAGVDVCFKQDLRLNVFFAFASTTCNLSALPVGTIQDRYGPRVCALLGSLFLAIGSITMALAFHIPEFDGYIFGNILLALGGTFIFVPSYAIANAFPRFSGTIVAAVTGAFDASAAVFLFYRLAYQASGGVFTPRVFFLCYLIVPIVIVVAQFTLMSDGAYKTVPQMERKIEIEQNACRDVHDSDGDLSDGEVERLRSQRREARHSKLEELDRLLGDADERRERAERVEERNVVSGVWGVLHGKSAHQQMLTPWFILVTLLTVLQMVRMNFFIATIHMQYRAMLGSDTLADKINDVFDIALPVGGVAATPFIGMLLDNTRMATLLAFLSALITVVGIVGSIPSLYAGYVNIALFVILRPLYYSAVSDYAAKVFGFATFGRVYGCMVALSGLINLSQPLIDEANHVIFNDNPIPINLVMAVLGFMIGTSLVIFVMSQDRQAKGSEHVEYFNKKRPSTIFEKDEDELDA